MTAVCALPFPLPRRTTSGSGLRLLPATPTDPPFDDEAEPRPTHHAPARATHSRVRSSRHTAGTSTSTSTSTTDSSAVCATTEETLEAPQDASSATALLPMPGKLTDAPVDRAPRRLAAPDLGCTESGRLSPSPVGSSARSAAGPALGRGPEHDVRSGRAAGEQRPLTAPRDTAVIVVRAIIEALAGARPVSHLARWTTPRLQHDLERTVAQLTDRSRGRVRSVRVSEPRPGVAEVSAVIIRGARAGALALRMESTEGRWRITTLQIG
ncbi:Energy transducer TonB [Frankia sp. AiPs1]|uniref:Rv3235 family protein n=1 Tax=Frankia sp. AiPa1 TaxID=573492 RepID=UPI00202B646E|nr:Rv3235 family protein [Frankia sp. AiPa1]MCL9760386.1 Rv3235 family protein [Frankia sp. AiPa1]